MTKGKLIIIGDFNIHFDSNSSDCDQFKTLLDMYNLTQEIKSPTHVRGHTLDLVISRSDTKTNYNVTVNDPLIFDHSAIIVTSMTTRPPRQKKIVRYRNF